MILQNKVALITGSSKGLGRAIALRYASLGANIVVNYSKDKSPADDVVAACIAMGVKAISVQGDASKITDIENMFSQALTAFGKIDIVVANAGVELVNVNMVDYTEADFDRLFTINVKGPFFVMQQAAKHIADGGRIINISSSTTVRPQPGESGYGGSKTPAKYFVEVLSKEIAHRKVTVNSIIPGPIDKSGIFTNMPDTDPYKKSLIEATPLGRLGLAEDVANVAEFLASDNSSFITGEHLLMNGGASF